MKRIVIAAAATASIACIEPAKAPLNAGGSTPLVAPGQSPPPTTSDASMPPSFPPPLQPTAAMQGNATYRTGNTFIVMGASFIGGGIAFSVLGVVLPCKLGDTDCTTQTEVDSQKSLGDAFLGVGIAAMIGGAVLLGVGIPLAVIGANQAKRDLGYALVVDRRGFGFRF